MSQRQWCRQNMEQLWCAPVPCISFVNRKLPPTGFVTGVPTVAATGAPAGAAAEP